MTIRFAIGVAIAMFALLVGLTLLVYTTVSIGRVTISEVVPAFVVMGLLGIAGLAIGLVKQARCREQCVANSSWILITALVGVWGVGFGGFCIWEGSDIATVPRKLLEEDRERLAKVESVLRKSSRDELSEEAGTFVASVKDEDLTQDDVTYLEDGIARNEAWLSGARREQRVGVALVFVACVFFAGTICLLLLRLRCQRSVPSYASPPPVPQSSIATSK